MCATIFYFQTWVKFAKQVVCCQFELLSPGRVICLHGTSRRQLNKSPRACPLLAVKYEMSNELWNGLSAFYEIRHPKRCHSLIYHLHSFVDVVFPHFQDIDGYFKIVSIFLLKILNAVPKIRVFRVVISCERLQYSIHMGVRECYNRCYCVK